MPQSTPVSAVMPLMLQSILQINVQLNYKFMFFITCV